MKPRKTLGRRCPCHSGQAYRACCRPFHRGQAPENVEQLMRSRFAAYALGDVSYILSTTHPDGAHHRDDAAAWAADVGHFCAATTFAGLDILDVGEAHVRFHAVLQQRGADASFTEHSTFALHDGRWAYVDGEPQ